VFFAGAQIPSEDLIQFISPVQGIIYQSEQCIATALKLEQARFRNSSSLQPAQVLKQTGGEPLSAEELAALSASFDQARMTNSTCAVNEFLDVLPQAATPDKMLLIDAANFQALEACRLTNIPSYLAGISVGGYSYVSNAGARLDLWSFGVKPYAECIAQTLSMNNVTPQGTYVAFDIDTYLEEDYSMSNNDKSEEENYQPEMAAK
jgi:phage portal protein BeeE